MAGSTLRFVTAITIATLGSPAIAQDSQPEPRRVRVGLGPQLVPTFPGSDEVSVRPLIGVAIARGSTPFEFGAPDQSFGPVLLRSGNWQFGPAIHLEGKRSRDDTRGLLPPLGFTVEVGGFVQYRLTPGIRVRSEVRKGVGGNKGVIGTFGADYVTRDADRWLFSVGPRVTLTDRRFQRSYFGIDPATAATFGTARYAPGGGLQSVGAATSFIYQFNPTWGISGYGKYDRLIDDPARSPIVRVFGSRDQLSGGVALTYTFGGTR